MPDNSKKSIRYALGRSTNRGKVENQVTTWAQFKARFKEPTRTNETVREYDKRSEDEQKRLKEVGGWWFRSATEGKVRNAKSALPSDLITLDCDYATEAFFDAARYGTFTQPWDYFIHTSRRYRPGSQFRFRMVILAKTPIPNDLYSMVSRIVAWSLDPDMTCVDKVSFRAAQMMYMPTASKGQEYVFEAHPGEPLDWEALVEQYAHTVADPTNIANWPKAPSESLRVVADKAEDPTTKTGPVGHFCRAFTIPEVIERFDLPYIPVDREENRYTYAHGTTSNGVEVYDGGLFLYSHHGSDPCSDRLVNAWDLVAIHKFGDRDTDTYDKPGDYPSFKAMLEFVEDVPEYRLARVEAHFPIGSDYDDLDDNAQAEVAEAENEEAMSAKGLDVIGPDGRYTLDEPKVVLSPTAEPVRVITPKRRPRPPKDWAAKLDMTPQGKIRPTVTNAILVILHDSRFRDALAFNQFTNKVVLRRSIVSKFLGLTAKPIEDPLSGDPLEDHHDFLIQAILEAPAGGESRGWGLRTSERNLKAGVVLTARENTFHPVRELLEGLTWDGSARAERLFIRYLGCPDTPYYRECARLFLTAAVARVYEPGHKFDFAPILWGAQGVRKSTFIKILALDWFGELKAEFKEEKVLVESMMGKWIMEMPELSSLIRSQVEDMKAFISGQGNQVRMSYDKNPSIFKRQTVFMGSTNDKKFLRDPTGNRRFWPLEVTVDCIDTDALRAEVDQVWAEAVQLYKTLRTAQPQGDLPLYLGDPEAIDTALGLQEAVRRGLDEELVAEAIQGYLDQETNEPGFGHAPKRRRARVTQLELVHVLNASGVKYVGSQTTVIANALDLLGWEPKMSKNGTPSRVQVGAKRLTCYVPGPNQISRWAEQDALEAIENVI